MSQVLLSLLLRPDKPIVTVSTPTPVNEGTPSCTMDCSASSKPDSNFTWQPDGQVIHISGPLSNFALMHNFVIMIGDF